MEQLKKELAIVLGKSLSRVEPISEQPPARLYALYDEAGEPLPMMAKYYRHQGRAALEAKKLAMLGHEGLIQVPAVYGLVLSQQPPVHEMLLLERIKGISAEAASGDVSRRQQLFEQVVEGLLGWHRIQSHGLIGSVDSVQENNWPVWYRQSVEVLWATLGYLRPPFFTQEDRQILFRSRAQFKRLFNDFDDPAVMLHGNFRLSSIIKEPHSDLLLAMAEPGNILWGPREYELIYLSDQGVEGELLRLYLSHAPVDDGFMWRRWLYQLWSCVDSLVHSGEFDRARFDHARNQLLPWLG
ncbi:phosphotransferase [Candidatus Pantoea multigeneris]|uniref:Phosphotransferase n=1 Tax=Candidatus Pantoea multigeneris TaxID=2608357 RepID=A0ABX0R895_9GAMM|nr:phosphotransferase [Pantoea multigeneris]NIF20683.1 phosphotransferase [Pantoea multigeneris]